MFDSLGVVEGNKHLFDVANRVREIVPELSGNEFEFNNDVDLNLKRISP